MELILESFGNCNLAGVWDFFPSLIFIWGRRDWTSRFENRENYILNENFENIYSEKKIRRKTYLEILELRKGKGLEIFVIEN